MRRRDFVTLLGGAALASPIAARAQQTAVPVIGFLNTASSDLDLSRARPFRQGLTETGYVEGGNVKIEYRWADGRADRLPALAADLVRQRVSVIAANGPASRAAREATATIPIVFLLAADPVQQGLVTSLNRPGGNLTGVAGLATEVGPKRLELLHKLVPAAGTLHVLLDPNDYNVAMQLRELQGAAHNLGLKLHILEAGTERDLETSFATLVQMRAGALMIGTSTFFNSHSEQLAQLSARHRLPAIFYTRAFATAGGLMTYGASFPDMYRQVGVYTGRILKGEKPADLPVEQPTKFDLIINLTTAKVLGLNIPDNLLALANEVVE
ncbi:MAG: ABC transporter substrate-binding protein [Proteobacteria bacterium]|nr:MAG: ABC transporter substrate-binding protein [Pseudomonadota bacterium]